MNEQTAGFGALMMLGIDHIDAPEVWRESMELLGTEVHPKIKHLVM